MSVSINSCQCTSSSCYLSIVQDVLQIFPVPPQPTRELAVEYKRIQYFKNQYYMLGPICQWNYWKLNKITFIVKYVLHFAVMVVPHSIISFGLSCDQRPQLVVYVAMMGVIEWASLVFNSKAFSGQITIWAGNNAHWTTNSWWGIASFWDLPTYI